MDATHVGELQDRLRCLTTTHKNCEVHRLSNLLDPNHEPQADAMDLGVILADNSESEEEEEDSEELVMIDESDNEGGNIFRMDTEPEV